MTLANGLTLVLYKILNIHRPCLVHSKNQKLFKVVKPKLITQFVYKSRDESFESS
jgi:hypothetical protein